MWFKGCVLRVGACWERVATHRSKEKGLRVLERGYRPARVYPTPTRSIPLGFPGNLKERACWTNQHGQHTGNIPGSLIADEAGSL